MRLRTLALLFLVLALAVPAVAQEQRGAIEGIVKDTSGAVLPGVTVEAKNVAVGSVAASVTDGNGVYRFPALAPGTYEVTANLQGFNTQKLGGVIVLLGQIKKVDFALGVGGVAETVQVSGEAPLVDVRQSARATSIAREQIDLLPKGRDFTTLVTQAPGANNEGKLGGLSIDGASAGENRYIVDGVETTNMQNGTSGKGVISDFIEEVQVKSSGYTAEFGGATGGVVNAVTKSGTNSFRGSARFYLLHDKLEASSNKTLRLNPVNSSLAEYWTYPEDGYRRLEPGFSLGGPVWKDRAWFFAAYQPTLVKTNRKVSPTTAGTPTASTFDITQNINTHNVTANQTAQIGNNLRTRLAFNSNWERQDSNLPALAGTNAQSTNFAIETTRPNWSVSGQADWVVKPNWFVGGRAGYYLADTYTAGVPDEIRYVFSNSTNIGYAVNGVTAPASYQHPTGWSNISTNSATTRNTQTRLNFQLDSTVYANLAGQHTIKGGVQVDRVGHDILQGEQKNIVTIRWDTTLPNFGRGEWGYYSIRSNGVYPKQGLITQGDISTTNIGLFLQDAWTVNNKLTINLGLRTENEKVPAYATGEGIPDYGIEFSYKDKLAPRVGFAYDVQGDGKWKVYGSWGIFYDIFKLELPIGSFGGAKWWEYYYTLDTYQFDTLLSGSNCPPACGGTLIRGPVDLRHPSFGSDAIEPDLKPMKSQEASFGLEHQLSPTMAISARYVRKWLSRAVEDTGSLAPDGSEIYIIANPGEGLTELAYTNPEVKQPKAKREYDSVEVAFTKNLANSWYLRTSYLWSRLYGNYSGLSQSDENGRTAPNVGRAFDYPIMSFDEHGKPVYGPLATDRPHQIKGQFIYQFPFGTSIGINEYVAQGIPVTREVGVLPTNNFPVQYLGRGSDGRMPWYSQTDVSVNHSFKVGGNRQLQIEAVVLNVLNQRTATNRHVTMQKTDGIFFNETDFYNGKIDFDTEIQKQGMIMDPRFLKDNGFQTPLNARFGVRFLF